MSQNLNLIWELAKNDFKVRYKSSIFGFLWSFMKPFLMLSVLYVVFSFIVKQQIHYYALYLLLGILLWNYFVEATTISINNMLDKREMIKSVYFDKKNLVISSCLNAFGTLIFNLLIFMVFLVLFRISFTYMFLVFLFYLLLLTALALGVSFFLASLYVKYRDVSHIWEVVINIAFWITPIFYSTTVVPEQYQILYTINPITTIIISSRDILIYNTIPQIIPTLIAIAIIVLVLVLGYIIYSKRSDYFAEDL